MRKQQGADFVNPLIRQHKHISGHWDTMVASGGGGHCHVDCYPHLWGIVKLKKLGGCGSSGDTSNSHCHLGVDSVMAKMYMLYQETTQKLSF